MSGHGSTVHLEPHQGNPIVSGPATESDTRWRRKFHSAASFSEDLGGLGAYVAPHGGSSSLLQGPKEDYVLRRVLVALHRENRLNHPLTIWAQDQCAPDFVIQDSRGDWGLEVTEAGSEAIQGRRTEVAQLHGLASEGHSTPLGQRVAAAANALERKTRRLNENYVNRPGFPKTCDLVVYDNCNAYSDIGHDLGNSREIRDDPSIVRRDPPTRRGFREVFLLREDGRTVYFDLFGSCQQVEIGTDYNIDFAEWIAEQVALLRAGRWTKLNIEELTEELVALAKRDRRSLRSHLQVLMHHLLKWQAQPDNRSSNWEGSIRNARDEIQGILEDSPSLWNELLQDLRGVYQKARLYAAKDTGLAIDRFPEECPFVPDGADVRMMRNGSLEFLNHEWFPN